MTPGRLSERSMAVASGKLVGALSALGQANYIWKLHRQAELADLRGHLSSACEVSLLVHAHQYTFSEQALYQVHRQFRGHVSPIKRRVEFDDIERAQPSGIGDHFHA